MPTWSCSKPYLKGVNVVSNIDSTTGLLSMALDAAVLRQQAIAQNIANANTPGYQRISVSFESRLAALADGHGQVRAPSLSELAAYRPRLEVAAPGSTARPCRWMRKWPSCRKRRCSTRPC
jgi:hypothetical protein